MSDPIRIDLFPGAERLRGVAHAAFIGFAITGVVMTFLTLFVLTLELISNSAHRGGWLALVLLAAVFVCVHVVLECRSRGPTNAKRWIVFAVCVAEIALTCWSTIRDPVGRRFFTAAAVIGALYLFAGRLMIHFAEWVNEQNHAVRWLVLLLGWSGPVGIVGMFFM